jgi:RNA polymerase sigma factor (sigma-70 family)
MSDAWELTDEVVRRAAEGAEPERTRVLEMLVPQVRTSVIARLSPTPVLFDAVDDLTQEVLAALTASIAKLRNRTVAGFYGWVSMIVRHKVCDLLKRRAQAVAQSLDSTVSGSSGSYCLWQLLSGGGDSPASIMARAEQVAGLISALGQLEPRHREIITLGVFDHLPTDEIAAQLNLAPAAARQLLRRALLALERKMTGGRGAEGSDGHPA